jgi:hypothetical protein
MIGVLCSVLLSLILVSLADYANHMKEGGR